MSLLTCALCGHYTSLPDSLWLRLVGVTSGAETTVCTPRCAVLWLEKEHKPTDLGVRL